MRPLNKIVHERARLLILTHLASNEKEAVSFNALQAALEFSSGNLSVQLQKLKGAGYVTIKKIFKENKPHTTVTITNQGLKALMGYLDEMESMIKTLKR